MATQRYISTSFWDDEWIQTLDPSEKLLYLYLMTNPLTNIAGVYKLTIRRIVFDTGFNADTVSHILRKFQEAKKAFHYNEYIILPSWPKHQKWEAKATIKTGIDIELGKLSEDTKKYMVSIGYRYPIEGYPYSPSYSDIDINLHSDIDIKRDEKSLPSEALALSELIFTLHHDNIDIGYKATEDKRKKWAADIEKLNRLDSRSWQDIEAAIRWIKTPGNFWAPNIISGSKLREKFPTIWGQMKRPNGPAPKVNQRSAFLEMEE
jgi:hypothetical protein